MIITYNTDLNTSIKYSPLKINFYIIYNVVAMEIVEQDDRLRKKVKILTAIINKEGPERKTYSIDICSMFSQEITSSELFLLGDQQHDNEIACYSFSSPEKAKNYVEDIIRIFENVNIFDTTIVVKHIDKEQNQITENTYKHV